MIGIGMIGIGIVGGAGGGTNTRVRNDILNDFTLLRVAATLAHQGAEHLPPNGDKLPNVLKLRAQNYLTREAGVTTKTQVKEKLYAPLAGANLRGERLVLKVYRSGPGVRGRGGQNVGNVLDQR